MNLDVDLQATAAQQAAAALQVAALDRAQDAVSLLTGAERSDAERLIELCQIWWAGESVANLSREDVLREGGRLVEVLARRSAKAMPFAALGRSLIAGIRGSEADKAALLREFGAKLSMLGL